MVGIEQCNGSAARIDFFQIVLDAPDQPLRSRMKNRRRCEVSALVIAMEHFPLERELLGIAGRQQLLESTGTTTDIKCVTKLVQSFGTGTFKYLLIGRKKLVGLD